MAISNSRMVQSENTSFENERGKKDNSDKQTRHDREFLTS